MTIFRLLALVAVTLVSAAQVARADQSLGSEAVQSFQIGFGNRYKLGCWTPATLQLAHSSGATGSASAGGATSAGATGSASANHRIRGGIEIQAPDADAVPVRFVGPSDETSPIQPYVAYTCIGRPDGPIDVLLSPKIGMSPSTPQTLRSLTGDDLPTALPATNEFIVELGASIGLAAMYRGLDQSELERTVVATLDTPQPLPDRWYGYEGVDMVVIVAKPAVEKLGLNAKQLDAIERWVRLGGTLCLVCGEETERLIGPGGPLARFVPGDFEGTVNLRRFGAIEGYAEAKQRLDALAPRVTLRAVKLRNVRGRIQLFDGQRPTDLPLVVRAPLGFGQLVFVGLDLHEAPFTEWSGRSKLLEKTLTRGAERAARSGQEISRQTRRLGFVDLAGQLRGALDQFEGVAPIPFWTISLLAIAYIAILFPLSYFVTTRWLKQPALAWFVLPGVIAVFCAGSYALAVGAKGVRLRINHLDLVDIDESNGVSRGVTWFNLFSPISSTYNLRVEPRFAGMDPSGGAPPSLLSWSGLAGAGLGGMNAIVASPQFEQPYTIDPQQGTVGDVPLAVWSSKSFVARWESKGGGIEADLAATADGRLRGTITNRLDAPLESCVVYYGGLAYPLEQLEAGETIQLERIESGSLSMYLSKHRVRETRYEARPYDRTGFDVARILEIMMFHEAAGGANYTGLLNRQHRFVDLSDQLEFGRAILVGQGPPGAVVEINGQPAAQRDISRHTTIYRYLLNVK